MMGDVIPFRTRTAQATRRELDEFGTVVTTEAVVVRGRVLPRGSQGTLICKNQYTDCFEVEFFHPFHSLVTLHRGQFR